MGSLFAPKTPAAPPVARMPDENDPAVLEARRKAAFNATNRQGRDSTTLAQGGAAQGKEYSGTTLGAGS